MDGVFFWLADFPWPAPGLWLTDDHFVCKMSAVQGQLSFPTTGVGQWVIGRLRLYVQLYNYSPSPWARAWMRPRLYAGSLCDDSAICGTCDAIWKNLIFIFTLIFSAIFRSINSPTLMFNRRSWAVASERMMGAHVRRKAPEIFFCRAPPLFKVPT